MGKKKPQAAEGAAEAVAQPQEQPQGNGGGRSKPANEFRCGALKLTVWANDGKDGVWHSYVLSRSYKQADAWKSAGSLGKNDLLPAALLLQEGFKWAMAQGNGHHKTPETAPTANDGGGEEIPF